MQFVWFSTIFCIKRGSRAKAVFRSPCSLLCSLLELFCFVPSFSRFNPFSLSSSFLFSPFSPLCLSKPSFRSASLAIRPIRFGEQETNRCLAFFRRSSRCSSRYICKDRVFSSFTFRYSPPPLLIFNRRRSSFAGDSLSRSRSLLETGPQRRFFGPRFCNEISEIVGIDSEIKKCHSPRTEIIFFPIEDKRVPFLERHFFRLLERAINLRESKCEPSRAETTFPFIPNALTQRRRYDNKEYNHKQCHKFSNSIFQKRKRNSQGCNAVLLFLAFLDSSRLVSSHRTWFPDSSISHHGPEMQRRLAITRVPIGNG